MSELESKFHFDGEIAEREIPAQSVNTIYIKNFHNDQCAVYSGVSLGEAPEAVRVHLVNYAAPGDIPGQRSYKAVGTYPVFGIRKPLPGDVEMAGELLCKVIAESLGVTVYIAAKVLERFISDVRTYNPSGFIGGDDAWAGTAARIDVDKDRLFKAMEQTGLVTKTPLGIECNQFVTTTRVALNQKPEPISGIDIVAQTATFLAAKSGCSPVVALLLLGGVAGYLSRNHPDGIIGDRANFDSMAKAAGTDPAPLFAAMLQYGLIIMTPRGIVAQGFAESRKRGGDQ